PASAPSSTTSARPRPRRPEPGPLDRVAPRRGGTGRAARPRRLRDDGRAMAWEETTSASFRARHETADADDAARVLDSLERTRARREVRVPGTVGVVTVVWHRSPLLLDLAHPLVPVERLLTAPAARRYVVGSATATTIHVLAPRALQPRASNVPGSREML